MRRIVSIFMALTMVISFAFSMVACANADKQAESESKKESETEHVHNLGEWVEAKEPTCTEDGHLGYYQCKDCGKYFNAAKLERITILDRAKGHQYEDKVVPPTETQDGYTEHTCTVCGHSFKDSYVDKGTTETETK